MSSLLDGLRTAACVLLLGAPARAEVVKLVVEQPQLLPDQAQPYEKLTGRFYGELDPTHPLNAVITDLELAPRNARGTVEYSASFTILKPADMSRATGVLVYQVPNRGQANIGGGGGYYAVFRVAGHVLVASGWQADIPPGNGVERLATPIAKNPDGSSITGPGMARFVDMPAGSTTLPIIRGRMTGTAMPASLDTSKATLTQRTSEDGSRLPIAASNGGAARGTGIPVAGRRRSADRTGREQPRVALTTGTLLPLRRC